MHQYIISVLIKTNQNRFAGVIYVFISSVITSLSFAPWKLWPLGFICVVPVIYYIEKIATTVSRANINIKRPVLKVVGLGCLQSILISLFAYHWITHTMMTFGHLPFLGALPIFLLYAVGTNLRWIFFFLLIYWFKKNEDKIKLFKSKNNFHRIVANPYMIAVGIWGVSDYFGWQLFPYYGINLVSGNIIFIQMVDILGTYGASLIWFLINYAFYRAFIDYHNNYNNPQNQNNQKKNPRVALKVAFITLLVCHIYGFAAYYYWNNKQKSYPTANIGIVQGNTPLGLKAYQSLSEASSIYLNRIIFQSYEIVQKAESQNKPLDLIIWPESSVPYIGYHFFPDLSARLSEFQKNHKVEFFINDLLFSPDRSKTYNNAFLLGKEGSIVENYQKVILLPFGEFLPFGDTFPAYKKLFAEVSDFDPGSKFNLFSSEIGVIMPMICYEVIIPDFVLDFHNKTQKNTQLMVNITNDSWFGKSIESSQHLELARLRSIELRLPLVRGVNAGISTWFDITGRNFSETELFTKANAIYHIPIPPQNNKHTTLYSLWEIAYIMAF